MPIIKKEGGHSCPGPNCGANLPGNIEYCPHCGTSQTFSTVPHVGPVTIPPSEETSQTFIPNRRARVSTLGSEKLSKDKVIEETLLKLNALEKEGAGGDGAGGEGGAFNGLSGTVFTSTNAGIFTPTHSERARRKAKHNKHKQDKKRKKLLGKDKKNGVERLVRFLEEGSPKMTIAKSPVSGMTGNRPNPMEKGPPNRVMTGQGQGPSAAGNNANNPYWDGFTRNGEIDQEIDWAEKQKGISKVEDHPTMGMNNAGDGKMMDASRAAPSINENEENPAYMTRSVPASPQWNNKAYVQKASTEIPTIGIGTNQNTDSHDIEKQPQAAYTEKFTDKEKKDQVLKQNDTQKRIQGYDNKDKDNGPIQDESARAVAGMSNYPNGSMQMMEKTWGTGPVVDALRRDSGEQITAIPEDEDFVMREKMDRLHNKFIQKGDPHPWASALMALDDDESI